MHLFLCSGWLFHVINAFDFFRESLAGSDIGMGMVALGRSIGGGGSASGGDVVKLTVEVMLDGYRWWMVVDSDGM